MTSWWFVWSFVALNTDEFLSGRRLQLNAVSACLFCRCFGSGMGRWFCTLNRNWECSHHLTRNSIVYLAWLESLKAFTTSYWSTTSYACDFLVCWTMSIGLESPERHIMTSSSSNQTHRKWDSSIWTPVVGFTRGARPAARQSWLHAEDWQAFEQHLSF